MNRTNAAMRSLLLQHNIDPLMPDASLDARLLELVGRGVVERDGCWLLAETSESGTSTPRAAFPDSTGYEAFMNHIHIEDVLELEPERDQGWLLRQGVMYARVLRDLLAPLGVFRIVVAAQMGASGGCGVRFYRRRRGEVWLTDDLEQYREDAILVIDTPELGCAQ